MPSQIDKDPTVVRRPTLKDVARESGYHITTVSKAIRDHPDIPGETRQKIKEIAQRLGYERNPVYFALSRFRQGGGLHVPSPRIAYLENFGQGSGRVRGPTMQAVLDGARSQAKLLGYELDVLAVGEDDHDSRSLTQYLQDHQITGIVLGNFLPGFAEIALNWDQYAVAKINSRHTEPNATVVGNDQLREVRFAFRRLTNLGYRRIGVAIGRADEDASGHRHTAGYLMETASLPSEQRVPPLLFPYSIQESELSGMIGRWVQRHEIDAILCNWSNILDMLQSAGLKTPDDVACASLCLCDPAPPFFAGVKPRFDLVGERAISIVVAQLKSSYRGLPDFPSSIYVQSGWQDGPSAPPRVY